eukprot:864949-Amphidinium_carterae.1
MNSPDATDCLRHRGHPIMGSRSSKGHICFMLAVAAWAIQGQVHDEHQLHATKPHKHPGFKGEH